MDASVFAFDAKTGDSDEFYMDHRFHPSHLGEDEKKSMYENSGIVKMITESDAGSAISAKGFFEGTAVVAFDWELVGRKKAISSFMWIEEPSFGGISIPRAVVFTANDISSEKSRFWIDDLEKYCLDVISIISGHTSIAKKLQSELSDFLGRNTGAISVVCGSEIFADRGHAIPTSKEINSIVCGILELYEYVNSNL